MLQLIFPIIYRKFLGSTKNLPKECFSRIWIENIFHSFLTIFYHSENFSEHFWKFRNILMQVFAKYCLGELSLFTECLSEHSNQLNCLNLVAGIRVGIRRPAHRYEDRYQDKIPPDKTPPDKIPPRTKSPQDKIPLDKIPPVYFIDSNIFY